MTDAVSADGPPLVIREHHLPHIAELEVDAKLLACRFAAGCSMSRCRGTCCTSGVWVDLAHRDRILAHADVIGRYMEPAQEHDRARWFEPGEKDDQDFESGRAISTATIGDGCVFLDSHQRCVLQLAEAEVPGLKPFYCWAYPIVIDHGVLTLDDEMCPEEKQCCGPVASGALDIMDVCAFELEHVVGATGVSALRSAMSGAKPPALPNGPPAA